ncbi:MAG: hypothetical protein EPN26_03355 [Rhodospirillales bacterium]|nr:MAG: hypothetical protein EPN26_03355 [Rhodospirillales bacterium]
MNPGMRTTLKILALAVSLVWIVWAGWQQFAALPEDAVQHHGSEVVKDRMKDCEGSFQQRYQCKEAIVIQSGRDTFNNMVLRLAIVFGPPFLLGILLITALPKARLVLADDVREKGDAWKSRVQPGLHQHTSVRVPAQPPRPAPAQSASPERMPEPESVPAPAPTPAPAPAGGSDWKKKAQQHMSSGKGPGEN